MPAGSVTRGHRFHGAEAAAHRDPGAYEATLLERGRVVADLDERRETHPPGRRRPAARSAARP